MIDIKSMEDWKNSNKIYFEEFFKSNDLVSKDVVEYFINSVPPITCNNAVVQSGEPYSHEVDPFDSRFKPKYQTFIKENNNWKYVGNRFKANTIAEVKIQEKYEISKNEPEQSNDKDQEEELEV